MPCPGPRWTTPGSPRVGLLIEAHDGLQRRLDGQLARGRPPPGRVRRPAAPRPLRPTAACASPTSPPSSTSRTAARAGSSTGWSGGGYASRARPARPTGAGAYAVITAAGLALVEGAIVGPPRPDRAVVHGRARARRARHPQPASCARCATSCTPAPSRQPGARRTRLTVQAGATSTGMPFSTAVPDSSSIEQLVGQQVGVHAGVAAGHPELDARQVVAPPVRDAHRARAGSGRSPRPAASTDPTREVTVARPAASRPSRSASSGWTCRVQRGLPFTSTSTLCIHELFERRSRRPTSSRSGCGRVEQAGQRGRSSRIGCGRQLDLAARGAQPLGHAGLERPEVDAVGLGDEAVEGEAVGVARRSRRRRGRCGA